MKRVGRRRVGFAVSAGEHHPDAAAHRVGEEEGAFVGGGELVALVEGDATERGAEFDRAFVFGNDRLAVAVIEERRGRRFAAVVFGFVERVADIEAEFAELKLALRPLVAGPARVEERARRRGEAIELLDLRRADVVGVELAVHGVEGEAEGVAEALGDDPPFVLRRLTARFVAEQRVAGPAFAAVGVDADDLAVEDLVSSASAASRLPRSAVSAPSRRARVGPRRDLVRHRTARSRPS